VLVVGAEAILTIQTLTLTRTRHPMLKAFAILLLTLRVFAFAALEMLGFGVVYSVVEGGYVPFKYLFNSIPSFIGVECVVLASIILIHLLITLTCWSTGSLVTEAFTVQFQALRILTLASLTLLSPWLCRIDFCKEFVLGYC